MGLNRNDAVGAYSRVDLVTGRDTESSSSRCDAPACRLARMGRTGRFTRGAVIVAVVALVAVSSGAVALFVLDDDSGPSTTTTSITTSTTEAVDIDELSGPARDLADLLERGRSTTYHARYRGSSIGESEGSLTLESWASEGRFRQDVRFEVAGQQVDRASFLLPDRGVVCNRSGDEPWACADLPRSEVQGAEPLTGSALAQLRDAQVGEAPGEVDGRPARCFTVSFDAQTTEMCVSPDGIPLQIRTAESRLAVEVLDDAVDDSVFEPPAASA